jgi:hypothetical protein
VWQNGAHCVGFNEHSRIIEIKASRLILFLLEPSAGAEVVALCKSIAEA